MVRKVLRAAAAVAMLTASLGIVPAHASACGAEDSARGEWPTFGGDQANSRNQVQETTINASNVADLQVKWAFAVTSIAEAGQFQATPAVKGGCVFVSTDTGWIIALNAEDGSQVWSKQYPTGGQVAGIFGLAVVDGLVYGNTVGPDGPFAFAVDAATGVEQWRSASLAELGSTINASAVVHNGLDLVALWGDDPNPSHRNGFAIIDAATGEILKKTFVIPPAVWDEGYAGGGIWGTAAIDTETGFAFTGTANPYSKTKEHEYTNAIIKIDLNRNSATFGEVVDSYKGETDNYAGELYDNPACEALGPQQTSYAVLGCFQLDIDFGSSPSIWTDAQHRTIVGTIQKSGVFHAADTADMEGVWQATIAPPLLLGNAGASTVIDGSVVTAGDPGVVWALDSNAGSVNWAGPTADAVRYQGISSANGVVYTVDGTGNFDAFDATNGLPLARRSIASDAASSESSAGGLSSAGVAIAEGTIFAPSAGLLVAYSL